LFETADLQMIRENNCETECAQTGLKILSAFVWAVISESYPVDCLSFEAGYINGGSANGKIL